MKKKNVIIFTSILLALLLIVLVITYIIELQYFSIVLGILFILTLLCLIVYLKSDNEFDNYIKERNRILRLYKERIEKQEGIPTLKNKDIIVIDNIKELMNINKDKVLYKNDNDSSLFLCIDNKKAYVYILKINDNVISPTWELINFMKSDSSDELDELEHTIEYKLDELHSYKIRPIKNTTSIKIVDGLGIREHSKKEKDN